ncbi:lipocalin family protein [Hymenobacter volaticus]|uniref:Lipocalin family protein n=1 Tax=Hymenobacter volaticus TaxID=2932254 RepID=A0ABY4G7K9_9BACT|nr:lipocalin family protein [Hymenobacter volaticus]UOQ66604.1 lipocalin family protein [Hymenobacter volaticus]
MKQLLPCISLALASALGSCTNDKKEEPSPQIDSQLLTSNTWKLTAETQTVGNAEPVAKYSTSDVGANDNTLKFLADYSLRMDEGATKDSHISLQTVSGKWKLSGKTLTIVVAPFTRQCVIQELTATKLIVRVDETLDGDQRVTRYMYEAQ